MNNIIVVQNFIALTKLFKKEPNFLFRYMILLLVHIFVQISLVAKLHYEIKIIL